MVIMLLNQNSSHLLFNFHETYRCKLSTFTRVHFIGNQFLNDEKIAENSFDILMANKVKTRLKTLFHL